MPIPSDVPAIDRRLLRDDVYGRLRDAIVDGTFAPGEQLRDLELADWLGVSRTPVREALLRLAEAGLVVTQPGRSTTVSTLDERAVRDARDVVAAMHEVAVREATRVLTAADLETMREANRRFGAAIEQGDVEAALRADDEFHGVLVRRGREPRAHRGARPVHAAGAPRGAASLLLGRRAGLARGATIN